jgi:hypothetical protein
VLRNTIAEVFGCRISLEKTVSIIAIRNTKLFLKAPQEEAALTVIDKGLRVVL